MNKLKIYLLFIWSIYWQNLIYVSRASSIKEEDTIIGISLGLTHSCVGVYINHSIVIIPDEFGNKCIPSIVAFTNDDDILVGEQAKNQAILNPKNTIYGIKRLVGKIYNDKEVHINKKILPYNIINLDNKPYIQLETKFLKQISLEYVLSLIITKLKITAEKYLGTRIKKAIITVPFYFNDSQRQSIKDSGIKAGLNIRIINENKAACYSYGLN